MPAAMPCKTSLCLGERKTKIDDSMRIRMEGVPHRYHEDCTAGRGRISSSHYSHVHKFIPMPQSNENTRCKGIMEKMRKLENTDMGI